MNYNELIKWLDKQDSLGIQTLGEVEKFTCNAKSKPNDTQYYSKIAKDYLEKINEEDGTEFYLISYNHIPMMEDLFDLFGGDRDKELRKSRSVPDFTYRKFKFVLDKLDKESKKPDAIFEKLYVNYPGVINAKTRAFRLKEVKDEK